MLQATLGAAADILALHAQAGNSIFTPPHAVPFPLRSSSYPVDQAAADDAGAWYRQCMEIACLDRRCSQYLYLTLGDFALVAPIHLFSKF